MRFGRWIAINCLSVNNQSCIIKPTLNDFNPGEHHYHLFMISLGRFDESFNKIDDPSGKICVPNKTEDVILKAFNMIKGINESKHNSWNWKSKIDYRKYN